MHSGRLMRAVPLAVLGIILLCLPVWKALSGPRSTKRYGPHLLPVATSLTKYNAGHPFIGHTLPRLPFTGAVGTAQGSGPWPDTNLTPNTLESSEIDPAAAPAGTMNRVAFATVGVDEDQDFRIDPDLPTDPNFVPNYNIWLMRPDGSECVQITDLPGDEVEPAWDPGSRWIAFANNRTGQWEIYTINLNTRAVYQITTGDGNKQHPTYSPDGNWIAYASDADGDWDIYKIPATGVGTPVQLTNAPGDETDPAWAPGSNIILYTGEAGGRKRIFQVDDQGGNVQMLSNGGGDPQADDQEPAWLRTGGTIVFASNRRTSGLDPNADFNIWQMTSAGEISGPGAVLLTNTDEQDDADDLDPWWSPELQRAPTRLFFESFRDDLLRRNTDIWAKFQTDNRPPELADKPWIDGPREQTPGADVTIHVRVYDFDTGVRQVFAILKDPDQKVWFINPLSRDPYFDSGFENGVRYYEWDFVQVGSVELFDDGDPANGDAQAGDGIFSGVFTTSTVARDYVIDILVVDNAGNGFTYDDIYGFTTRTFQPHTNVLFVDDYCEGQAFLYLSGLNNDFPAAWPVESWYTFNPSFEPSAAFTIDYDTIHDYYQEDYDVWRIICRGPVPPYVYQYYLPTIEYQLDPQEAVNDPEGAKPTREVLVADRAIVWACPHAGDVWIGEDSGSLLDAATQADLALFLERGGRLFLIGENIAWALTLNGTVSNTFLTQYLKAQFLSDTPRSGAPVTNYYIAWPAIGANHDMLQTAYGFEIHGQDGDPIADDPWAQSRPVRGYHARVDEDDRPMDMLTPRFASQPPYYTDAHEFSFRPDEIQELGGAIKVYGYGSFDGPTAGLRYVDAATGARVVFLSFGFEQIHRGYHSVNNFDHCKNHRSHLMHHVLCWLRTGGFQGRVISISDGGKPITDPNPIIYCRRAGGAVSHAVRCQDDGTYVIQALPPDFYTLEAVRPGYEIDHYEGEFVHGGLPFRVVDFAIKRAQPGSISGLVTSEATGEALGNVLVCANPVPREIQLPDGTTEEQLPEGTWPKCTRTRADGTYTIADLPPWEYEVTADGSDVDHGTAGPQRVTVVSGSDVRVDFQLPAADGTIVATVLDATTSQPLDTATVEVLLQGRKIAEGPTDSQGIARISVQPGTYQVVADAPRYGRSQPQDVVVVSNQETAVTILMTEQPPGAISGRIVSAVSGEPVGGITIRLIVAGEEYATVVSLPELHQDTPGGPVYNWRFDAAPAGTVVVRPAPEGFSSEPPEVSVTVVSGQETSGIVFKLRSLHTFPAGLSLISLPGDYTDLDPAIVFGVQPGDRLRLAAWEATRGQYSVYPQAPADIIRPGWGYWLYLNVPTDLTRAGNPPSDPTTVQVYGRGDNRPTWNLVGCPFEAPVDIYSVQVRDSNNVLMDWQTAQSRGKILSVLYAYVVGQYQPSQTLSPYRGYWLAVNEPLTLIIPNVATTGASGVGHARQFPAVGRGGWAMPVVVSAGEAVDACTYIGVNPEATAGFDAGIDQPKPPPPGMAPYVAACAVHDDWGPASGRYAVDMRPSAEGQTYRLLVETNLEGERVTVAWPDLSDVPRNLKPVLRDPVTGKEVYMRTATSHSFISRGPRELEVTFATSEDRPLVVSSLQALARGQRVEVRYVLSQQAVVDASVVNISGRVVRVLTAGRMQPAGTNVLVWDRRNQAGSPVPSGRYLVVVRAHGENGQVAQGIAPVVLGR